MKLILNYLTCTFEYFSRNCYVFTISWRSEVSIVNQGINLRGWDLGVHFYLVWSGFFSLEKTAQKWVGEKFFKKIRKKMSFLVLAWTDYFSYKNIPICKKRKSNKNFLRSEFKFLLQMNWWLKIGNIPWKHDYQLANITWSH